MMVRDHVRNTRSATRRMDMLETRRIMVIEIDNIGKHTMVLSSGIEDFRYRRKSRSIASK